MALTSLVIIFSTIRSIQETSASFRDNLTFYASQLEYETIQFLDHIDRHQSGEVSRDDLILRFDILWSRVFTTNNRQFGNELRTVVPEVEKTQEFSRTVLSDIEAAVLNLDVKNTPVSAHLKSQVREILGAAHELSLVAKDLRNEQRNTNLILQLRQAYLTFALISGMAVFGVVAIILMRIDRGEIHRMNQDLEHRVVSRTHDLQLANSRLAAEISERRRSQEIAFDRETRLSQAVQLAKLGYFVRDMDAQEYEFCSDFHAAAYGMTPTELMEKSCIPGALIKMVHPNDRPRVEEHYQELKEGKTSELDYRIVSTIGTRRIREVSRPILVGEKRQKREIGSTIDVTDQYDTEMKLFESQRMDSIGKMTGGVAHDFNNLLAVILGNLELLRELPNSDDRGDMIEDAIQATLRGRDLTMNMLSFARRAPIDPAELNLNDVLQQTQGMLRRALPENIVLKLSLGDDLNSVIADRSLTQSALLNFTINARDAMPDGGKLTVETANVELDQATIDDRSGDVEPGEYVLLSVTDSGTGMAPNVVRSIFEPFFTTKEVAENSGLGLSMVQGFIRQTGGTVHVYSEPGIGTTFKLFFKPAPLLGEADIVQPDFDSHSIDRKLRVLLVEDEVTVQKILARQLEESGLVVVSAGDAPSAEKAFTDEGPFDVIVSDVVMPGKDQGPDLVAKIRETEPEIPAVFLSGYPPEAMHPTTGILPSDLTLMKPVTREKLVDAIKSAERVKAS